MTVTGQNTATAIPASIDGSIRNRKSGRPLIPFSASEAVFHSSVFLPENSILHPARITASADITAL